MAMNIEKKGLGNTDIASIKQLFLIYPPLEQGSMRESNFKYRYSML